IDEENGHAGEIRRATLGEGPEGGGACGHDRLARSREVNVMWERRPTRQTGQALGAQTEKHAPLTVAGNHGTLRVGSQAGLFALHGLTSSWRCQNSRCTAPSTHGGGILFVRSNAASILCNRSRTSLIRYSNRSQGISTISQSTNTSKVSEPSAP